MFNNFPPDHEDNPLNKTQLLDTTDDGPIVVKNYLHPYTDREFKVLKDKMTKSRESFDKESQHPNVVCWSKESPQHIILTGKDKNVLCVRQYICYNLNEKIAWLPTG